MFKYFPHTDDDLQQMLERVGVDSLDALYADIPETVRFRREYNLPERFVTCSTRCRTMLSVVR